MNDPGDPALVVLDAHIRAQLASAAQDYALHTDLQARLAAILEACTHDNDGATTKNS